MRILNPVYDTAFKYLMEDIEIAKELIALIIDQDVVELHPAPQEQTSVKIKMKYSQIALQHLDYVAIIKTVDAEGQEQFEKVMVEVQKSPFKPAIGRFRKYVAEKYKHKSVLPIPKKEQAEGEEETPPSTAYLPMKTIYFIEETFNDKLPGILHRSGQYYNALDKSCFEGARDEFVELLNHDSWFIQLHCLPNDLKNRIIKILSVFTDWYRDKNDKRYLDYPSDDIEKIKDRLLRRILNRLLAAAANDQLKLELELEIEYEDDYELLLNRLEKQKEEAKAREEEERRQKEEAKAKEKSKSIKFAIRMKKYGESIEEIIRETGLLQEEIEKL